MGAIFGKSKDEPTWNDHTEVAAVTEDKTHAVSSKFQYSKFQYSKYLITTLMRSPVRQEYIQNVSNPKNEMADALITAMIVFMQLIYNVHKRTIEDWDHSTPESRIALAVSGGIAIKFSMDHHPYSSSFFMASVLKPGEMKANSMQELTEYISKYETVLLKNINVFRCCFNHRDWSTEFLYELRDRRELTPSTTNRVYEILYFVCFNICDLLPQYVNYSERVMAEAITVLSIQCTEIATWPDSITKSRFLCESDSYDLSSKIGHSLAEKPKRETQDILGGCFCNKSEWQHRATEPCIIRRAAHVLEKRSKMASFSNRK